MTEEEDPFLKEFFSNPHRIENVPTPQELKEEYYAQFDEETND